MKKLLLSALILLSAGSSYAQNIESATQAVVNMRLGWNLGNTLDSNSGDVNNMWIEKYSKRKTSDYETAWKQPVTKPELIKLFKDTGFNAIRVPVTWYPHMEAKITELQWDPKANPIGTKIQPDWMKRVHEIVDYVISQDMYCILNIHHDTGAANTAWLRASEESYAENKETFEAIWTQIAEEFKDYDGHLLFEGYNEMLDPLSSWCFASFAASGQYNAAVAKSAYNAINSYAQSFVNAVRATGGNNAERNLIVTTYGACCGEGTWNTHLLDPLKEMKLPEDSAERHLIFEVHSYPNIAGGLNNAKNSVKQMMKVLKAHLFSKGAPIIIGEWGTFEGTDDYNNRRQDLLAFARDFVEQAKSNGITTFHWMGLSDGDSRSVPEFNQPDLVEAIVKGYYGDRGFNAINSINAESPKAVGYYNLQGQHLDHPARGINIVRMSDGSVKKVINK